MLQSYVKNTPCIIPVFDIFKEYKKNFKNNKVEISYLIQFEEKQT